MKKITLGALLVGLLSGCSGADPSPPKEIAKSTSQPLTVTTPGWINAFAGSGVRGSSPTGTAALSTLLDSRSGLALCPDGALYVSDTGNNRVVKFSGGVMSVVVDGQTTPSGKTYGNLIVNPRAEGPIVSSEPQGWIRTLPGSSWTEIQGGGTLPEALDGEKYFRMNDAATGEMYQDIPVAAYQTAIAAGTQKFEFTGFVDSLAGATPDAAQIIIEYRNASGTVIGSYDSGPQQSTSEWHQVVDVRVAPVTTQTIRVRLISTRHTVPGNDAYYDGLLLRALPGTTLGDGGPGINATLALPHGLACAPDGSLYIADSYNDLVRVVKPNGIIATFAGTGAPNELSLPMSVSLSAGSNYSLLIADFLNHRIRTVPRAGGAPRTVFGFGGVSGPPPDSLSYPMGVQGLAGDGTEASTGHMFVADRSNNAVLSISPFEVPIGFASSQLTNGPGFSDALTPYRELFSPVRPPFGKTFHPVAIASNELVPGTLPLSPARTGATVYPHSNYPALFVADLSNHAIRHVMADGVMQTVAGNGTPGDTGDGGSAYQALFTAPAAIAQSRDGTVYVADAETNRIRAIYCADVDLRAVHLPQRPEPRGRLG